jgi:hypothetical protein
MVRGEVFVCRRGEARAAKSKISREQVWCDVAAIQRQLGCVVR